MARSRHALVEAALAEDALLIATHIREAGRLRRPRPEPDLLL
jgi:hypothetical protein